MKGIDPIPNKTKNALMKPAAKAIGEAFGTILNSLAHWSTDGLARYNISHEADLKDFKAKYERRLADVPEAEIDDSKLLLVAKAIEDGQYRMDEDYMREAFARLITHASDRRTNNDYKPLYSSILSNLSSQEAKLLIGLSAETYSLLPLERIKSQEHGGSAYSYISGYAVLQSDGIIYFEANTTLTLELLQNAGLVSIKPQFELTSPFYQSLYNMFEWSTQYADFKNTHPISSGHEYRVERGDVELTELGKSFTRFINN